MKILKSTTRAKTDNITKKFFPYRLEPYFICYEANRSLNSKVQWRNKTHTFSRYQSNRLSVRSSVHTPQQQIITLIMLVVFLWGIDRLIALGYCCWINLSLGDIIFLWGGGMIEYLPPLRLCETYSIYFIWFFVFLKKLSPWDLKTSAPQTMKGQEWILCLFRISRDLFHLHRSK